jgi:hypothetical protein
MYSRTCLKKAEKRGHAGIDMKELPSRHCQPSN